MAEGKEAKSIEAMANCPREVSAAYVTKNRGGESGMRAHCQGLVDAAKTEVTEYDAMAAEHEEMAKKAK